MAESKFGFRLRMRLAEQGLTCIRIESHSTSPGCPDIHYVSPAAAGWIELKEMDNFTSRVEYRPKQALWLTRYAKAGGRCCTVVHLRFLDNMIVIPGPDSILAGHSLAKVDFWTFHCSEPMNGWKELARILTAE